MLPGWAPTSVRWGFRARARASTVGGMRRSLLLAVLAALAAAAPARARDGDALGLPRTGRRAAAVRLRRLDHRRRGDRRRRRRLHGRGRGRADRVRAPRSRARRAWRRCASPRAPAWTSSTSGSAAARPARATGRGPRSTPLETLAAGSLDGSLFAGATGDWVEVGLRCETPDPRCDAPGRARRPALRRADRARRRRADLHRRGRARGSPAARSPWRSTPRDGGIGVARVSATLGGRSVATAAPASGRCAELSPADATADLPLAEDCPPSDRLILSIDSTAVADGLQRLELLVADGAGNTTAKGFDVRVANTPLTPAPNVPPVLPPGGVAIAAAAAAADDPEIRLAEPLQGGARRHGLDQRELPRRGAGDLRDHAQGDGQAPRPPQGRDDRHRALDRQAGQAREDQPAAVACRAFGVEEASGRCAPSSHSRARRRCL